MASSKEIVIVIDVADKASGNLAGIKNSLLAIDAAEQTMKIHDAISSKFKSMGLSQYQQDAGYDYYHQQSKALAEQLPAQFAANQQKGWDLLRDLFGGSTAHAATLSEEQLLQQAQMEQPLTRTIGEAIAEKTQPAPELLQPGTAQSTMFDISALEQMQSDIESFTEGLTETFTGLGESINECMNTAFEGVGETFSNFTESIGENLTSAFEGISEYFSEIGSTFADNLDTSFEAVDEVFNGFGDTIMENLTSAFESAGTIFTSFGESLTSTLTTAQASAEASLVAIGTAFETTKTTIQSSWAELPGFFAGVFSGLGSAAASAGASITAGLTAPIGSIIGAWQSAAAQISSIISSISAQAASMPSVNIGGSGTAYAEGGFVNSPTSALIGEAGAEVVIPLSSSKRARALDLFEKTAQILGGDTSIPQSDFASSVPELANNFSGEGFTLDAPTPVTSPSNQNSSQKIEISLGGIHGTTFTINGNNPQEIMATIKGNISELADKIAGQLSVKIGDCFGNMALEH